MGPLALGTDGGGSVRIPASCCGIVGLKATLGAVPHIHAPDLFANNSYIGPMTRTVADARLMFEVISGPDGRDPYAQVANAPMPGGADLKGLRVGWLGLAGNRRIDAEVLAAAKQATALLEDMGAVVTPLELDFAAEEDLFLTVMQSAFNARLARHVPRFAGRLDPTLVRTIEAGERWTAADLQATAFRRSALFRRIQEVFASVDLIASPTLSAPPLPADQDAMGQVIIDGAPAGTIRGAWYPYTYPFNLTGHPALSLPCGWTASGLPMGYQMVAPWHGEARLFDVAARLEAARPWADRRPPL
jgi:aspartyl-tRNA(Asn)/glutamyl-tRNA(Gln) amidotransferase subunit A